MKIWFMYDDYTFAKVSCSTREALIGRARDLFRQDGCGGLFVRDEGGGTLESLTLHGTRQDNGRYGISDAELQKWADEVEAERLFRTLMA